MRPGCAVDEEVEGHARHAQKIFDSYSAYPTAVRWRSRVLASWNGSFVPRLWFVIMSEQRIVSLTCRYSITTPCSQIVQDEYGKVVALLKERWGFTRFFASLYATGNSELKGYPLTEEKVGEIVNYDLTGAKQRAWAWADGDWIPILKVT